MDAKHCFDLAKRGYEVNVTFSGDTVACVYIEGGDSNCPHLKYYDPADGHGYTHVHMDNIPGDVLDGLDDGRDPQAYCEGLFEWMRRRVLELEGRPWGP